MSSPVVIPHRPRHFFSVKNHPLSGVTTPQWIRLMRDHGSHVEIATYFPRLIFLTIMSLVNTIGAIADSVLYGRAIASQELNDEPVFILGHPRTGTTHLHNLLSRDPSFAFATTFSVGFPSGFLSCRWLAPFMGAIMDDTRPMDNMALSHDTPQEDEVATNQLSGGASPYMPLMFPKREALFRRWYSMRDGASSAEIARWKESFLYFLRKTQYAAGGKRKRLLLKSPVHTARVDVLLEMFPKAQFVFIHRNPYEVFQSAVHMADAYYWQCYFQVPSAEDVQEFILYQGEYLHDAYERDIRKVKKGNKHEVRFDELNKDPLGTLRALYDALGWSANFASIRPAIESYAGSLRDFKMNAHARLSEEAKEVVRARWGNWFKDLGYDE
jgi:hypothetical protein